jgi:perosamine synthetase
MIPLVEPVMDAEELNNVIETVSSGWVSSKGKFIPQFEENFAQYCVKYGVATSNGTVALHLALTVLQIKEGDEIIVPDLTFVATANAVKYTGAKPVFVEPHPDYWGIDPEKIEEAITPRTKAIIPVHLYGHPCDMDAIMNIAKKHNLLVIEDAAQAHGAKYKSKKVGSFGDISCFSFFGNKLITTGEGGMCLTNDKKLAHQMKILRDHGMNPQKRYWHDVVGFNYRMTNMQAALGVAQLEKLDEFILRKREIAKKYSEQLRELEEKGLIKLHPEMNWAHCVFWIYSILIEENFGLTSDKLAKKLEEGGVETRPFFNPLHLMPPYASLQNKELKVAEKISKKGINLPSGVSLRETDLNKIGQIIINWSQSAKS